MKRKLLSILCIFSALFWLSSCEEPKEEIVHSVEAAPAVIEALQDAGSSFVSLSTNTLWDYTVVTSDGTDWCKITFAEPERLGWSGNHAVTVTLAENPTDKARTATITFTAKTHDAEAVITVKQRGQPSEADKQQAALVEIAAALGAENWLIPADKVAWGANDDISTWAGITANEEGLAIAIDFQDLVIQGEIPARLTRIAQLESLNFNNADGLTGNLPAALSALTKLREFKAQNTGLSGTLPAEWAAMTQLRTFDVAHNDFSGPLPEAWAAWTELRELNLAQTSIDAIPAAVFPAWKHLASLRLHNIPTLAGSLPEALAQLKSDQAEVAVWLNDCNFEGGIPATWAQLPANLKVLRLHGNQLSQAISREFQAHANFALWNVEENGVNLLRSQQGDVTLALERDPQIQAMFTQLTAVYEALDGDHWTYPAESTAWFSNEEPQTWAGVSVKDNRIVGLNLANFGLKGELPAAFAQITGLTQLVLSENPQLTGSLPQDLKALTQLSALEAAHTGLGGTLPAALFEAWKKMSLLNLSGNANLGGDLPADLAKLVSSENSVSVRLDNCAFEGGIPEAWNQLPANILDLRIHNNLLTDTISLGFQAHDNWEVWNQDKDGVNYIRDQKNEVVLPLEVEEEEPEVPVVDPNSPMGLLLRLNAEMDGANWTYPADTPAWNPENKLNTWYGVTLNPAGQVIALDLSGLGLKGELSGVLGLFPALESLKLNNLPGLTGALPDSLSLLTNLKVFEAETNGLSGVLPAAYKAWTLLETFKVGHNQIEGAVPQGWSAMTNMVNFELHHSLINSFPGKSTNNWAKLRVLHLDHNPGLTGGLINAVAKLPGTASISVWLNDCNFTGGIPADWLNMPATVTDLRIHNNQLTEQLPAAFQKLANFKLWNKGGDGVENYLRTQQNGVTLALEPIVLTPINISIQQALALPLGEITEDYRITGFVISDLASNHLATGNCFIEDSRGYGICLRFKTEHFLEYNTKVTVSLLGAKRENYNGLPQINGLVCKMGNNGSIKDYGELGPGEGVDLKDLTISQILNFEDKWIGTLVKIQDVQFVDPTAIFKGTTQIEDRDGNRLDVYTPNYALFAEISVPENSGEILGILSVFKGKPQLILRISGNYNDISDMKNPRF